MKVIVKKYLNVRIGSPSVNAPCYNYLAPGSVIEVEDKPVIGDLYRDNNLWYKGLDGSYYWSGGVGKMEPEVPESHAKSTFNYNTLLTAIPKNIRDNKGAATTIAIFDSGCSTASPDLNQQILHRYDPFENKNADDHSTHSHGTFIASVICGHGLIEGIASKAKIIVIKVFGDQYVNQAATVLDGLKWLQKSGEQVDVLTMSLDFSNKGYVKDFDAIFADFSTKGTLLVAAAGDNGQLFTPPILYPANHKEFIAVAAIQSQLVRQSGSSAIDRKVSFVFPDVQFTGYSKTNSIAMNSGSSFATALTAGMLALYIADYKAKNTAYSRAEITSDLTAVSGKIDHQDFQNNLLKPYVL